MTYATPQDIVTLYSADALYVADRDNDGVADDDVMQKALVSASAEIDSHLAARYSLPIAGTHEVLLQLCVDIALYRMASSADVMTDSLRMRYEDALKHLMRFSDGKAKLILPVDPDETAPDGTPVTSQGPSPIVTGGPERQFTRTKMADL